MNDTEKQELDPTTTEARETAEEQVETTAQDEANRERQTTRVADSNNRPSKLPMGVAVLAMVVALGGLGMGYTKLVEIKRSLQQGQQAVSQLQSGQQETKGRLDESGKTIAAQQAAFAAQDQMMKQERTRLEQKSKEMRQALDSVFERIGRSSTQWVVAEAEYLMRIANHRLQLEGDAVTALVAMEAADMRLRDSGDPVWNGVREQLANEMTEIKSIKMLDLAGNASRLSGLIAQVEKLKLPQSGPVVGTKSEGGGVRDKKEFTVDRVLQDGWDGFKSLVVIRKNDQPLTAMLGPEQRFFLYQNLRMQLESARMALLRRDQSLFNSSLDRATMWVGKFFDQEQASTKAMHSGIGDLKGLQVKPKLPDISGSLRMLLQLQRQISEAQKASS